MMKTTRIWQWIVPISTAALLLVGAPTYAEEAAVEPEQMQEINESVQKEVEASTEDEAAERRKKIIGEAATAIAETKNALAALDEGKPDEALVALERATGKLEILLAREPDLALAPVDVQVVKHDLLTTVEAIELVRDEAEDLLEDGRLQEARELLAPLGSEVVVSVVNLPLATYPGAIKAASALIDKGEAEEAAMALQAALSTQVVTSQIIPLPVVRAQGILADAEELAETEDRSEEDDGRLADLLATAREQLRMAEVLGYGTEKDYKAFHKQIDKIEGQTADGEAGDGWFDGIKKSLSDFRESFL